VSLEEAALSGIVGAGAKKLLDTLDPTPKHGDKRAAQAIRDRLDVADAQTLLLKAELRCALLQEAKELLPEAVRQAKPHKRGKHHNPGSPALLRLISSMVFRNIQADRARTTKK
jgi:hypothetical protein